MLRQAVYTGTIDQILGAIIAWWIFILIAHILIALAVGNFASKKGRSAPVFFWLAFVGGWFLPVVALATVSTLNTATPISGASRTVCRYCDELVSSRAILCKHCGSQLGTESEKTASVVESIKPVTSIYEPMLQTNPEPLSEQIQEAKPGTLIAVSVIAAIVGVISLLYSFSYGYYDSDNVYHANELHLESIGLLVFSAGALTLALAYLRKFIRINKESNY